VSSVAFVGTMNVSRTTPLSFADNKCQVKGNMLRPDFIQKFM